MRVTGRFLSADKGAGIAAQAGIVITPEVLQNLRKWLNRSETNTDTISLRHARLMAGTIGQDPSTINEGQPLPYLWHWIYFLEGLPPSKLGPDGHPARGGFLPPVPLPNRMWAGGNIQFHHPVSIGDVAEKRSFVKAIEPKSGRSGELVFVKVGHEVSVGGKLAIEEEHDIVYRQHSTKPATPTSSPAKSNSTTNPMGFVLGKQPTNSTLLFRYSALTFNGHRIHYDIDYCRNVEGYDGLIVHGPLQATWLAAYGHQFLNESMTKSNNNNSIEKRPLKRFTYRALSPVICGTELTAQVVGHGDGHDSVTVTMIAPDGRETMQGVSFV